MKQRNQKTKIWTENEVEQSLNEFNDLLLNNTFLINDLKKKFLATSAYCLSMLPEEEDIYEILGETLVEEINEELGIDIELSEEYDTISGYIQYKLGKVANIDDKVTTEGYIIQVLKVDNNKIEKIKLIIKR